jgi:hypothetical protein
MRHMLSLARCVASPVGGYQSIDTRTSFDDPLSPSTVILQSRF